jgi:PKD repeat protein
MLTYFTIKKTILICIFVFSSALLQAQLQRTLSPPAINNRIHGDWHQETSTSGRVVVFQDFETYPDFSLEMSPWTTNDQDGSTTFGIEGYQFPHSGEAMSFIVFNPSATSPPIQGDPAILPHGGYKYAACFVSTTHQNYDWIISPLIELGSNGHLKFWVKSYTANYGLERYKVGVSTTNPNPSSFTFISGHTYLEAQANAWEQKEFDLSVYNGQDIYIGIQCVSNDAFIFMLDDIEIGSQLNGNSVLKGKVTDAVTGNPVSNALVSVAGLSDNTDENGNYMITNVPKGELNVDFTATPLSGDDPLNVQFTDLTSESNHTVTASAAGYINYQNSNVVINVSDTVDLSISLSPVLQTGQYRIVLTWGESPADLDSHLKTPLMNDSSYHINYYARGSADSPPFATLDLDDMMSFGPETITIYELYPGEYHFFVHNYTGSPEISLSNAMVQVYGATGLLRTMQVPASGTGAYWDVLTINGITGDIDVIDKIVGSEPGGQPKMIADRIKKEILPASRNLVSWTWDFGDSGSSTLQNPSHTYTTEGSYTVSLIVNDGLNNKILTKYAYIFVGPTGLEEVSGQNTVSIYPVPAKDRLYITSGIPIESVMLIDINGRQQLSAINCGNNCLLEVDSLPDGIYFLRVDTENGIVHRKVMIRR